MSWQDDFARKYDAKAVSLRAVGCFDAADFYAEQAHSLRSNGFNHPRRRSPEFPIRDRVELATTDAMLWDELSEEGVQLDHPRPHGPWRDGSSACESGSIASGGTRTYCTCDICF